MQNNNLWLHGKYHYSGWLSKTEIVNPRELWDHIEMACGTLWNPDAQSGFSVDTCKVYWDERERQRRVASSSGRWVRR